MDVAPVNVEESWTDPPAVIVEEDRCVLMDGLFDGAAVALGSNAIRSNVELTKSKLTTRNIGPIRDNPRRARFAASRILRDSLSLKADYFVILRVIYGLSSILRTLFGSRVFPRRVRVRVLELYNIKNGTGSYLAKTGTLFEESGSWATGKVPNRREEVLCCSDSERTQPEWGNQAL